MYFRLPNLPSQLVSKENKWGKKTQRCRPDELVSVSRTVWRHVTLVSKDGGA